MYDHASESLCLGGRLNSFGLRRNVSAPQNPGGDARCSQESDECSSNEDDQCASRDVGNEMQDTTRSIYVCAVCGATTEEPSVMLQHLATHDDKASEGGQYSENAWSMGFVHMSRTDLDALFPDVELDPMECFTVEEYITSHPRAVPRFMQTQGTSTTVAAAGKAPESSVNAVGYNATSGGAWAERGRPHEERHELASARIELLENAQQQSQLQYGHRRIDPAHEHTKHNIVHRRIEQRIVTDVHQYQVSHLGLSVIVIIS
jgi:hypothetical protein